MNRVAVRARDKEWMDGPDLDVRSYEAVLRELSFVNRWTFAYRPVLSFLTRALTRSRDQRRFRLLEVGFGYGDMLREIARWAAGHSVTVELLGVDLRQSAVDIARAATPSDLPINYLVGDFRAFVHHFDCVISSQVAHHLDEQELEDFIRFMEATAARGWIISDLHRHAIPHMAFPLLARAMRLSTIARIDGQRSIARAFRPSEWNEILAAAGLAGGRAKIVRYFPYRLCVEHLR